MDTPLTGRSPWSPAPRAAPDAASPARSARPARPCIARAAACAAIRRRTAGRETIEETAEMIDDAGGTAIAVRVDHTVEAEVEALFARIDREHGRARRPRRTASPAKIR